MKKQTSSYVCQSCHYRATKWLGRCPECENWNSFEEEISLKPKKVLGVGQEVECKHEPKAFNEIKEASLDRIPTQITEFDRLLGGGFVKGAVLLLAGDPGVGKSTLLASVLSEMLKNMATEKALYVSGEESIEQVAQRMKRIGVKNDRIMIYSERNWQEIKKNTLKIKPRLLIIDSIQTIYSNQLDSSAGSISQIKEVTDEIIHLTKESNLSTLIVGHITKEGGIAGPKTLEHMVDTVMYFENSHHNDFRIIRVIKNRFGPTTEVGIFEMKDDGIQEVSNAQNAFLEPLKHGEAGRIVATMIEGSRVLVAESQALVNENKYGQGKRLAQGVNLNRVLMLIAIIEKFLAKRLSDSDVYINMIGLDVKSGKSSDLAIVTSILTSIEKLQLDQDIVVIGEIGLSGEIRPVRRDTVIIDELLKLNFKKIIVSSKTVAKYNEESARSLKGINHVSQLKEILRRCNEDISLGVK